MRRLSSVWTMNIMFKNVVRIIFKKYNCCINSKKIVAHNALLV